MAVRHWVVLRTVERDFGQWVRGQIILGFAVGIFTFIGLIVLSHLVDPIFGRYAVLLSVIAGDPRARPIIGPIISAVPAVLLAATAGTEAVIAALVLYTLVQQVENNFLVPKIQGDADRAPPGGGRCSRSSSAASLAGPARGDPRAAGRWPRFRDVVRYLLPARSSPDDPERRLAGRSIRRVGMGPGCDALTRIDPYKTLQVDPEAEDEVIQAAYRRLARKYHPDVRRRPEAAARMAAINAAWELIGEPEARAAYDRDRAVRSTRRAPPSPGRRRHRAHRRPPRPAGAARTAAEPPAARGGLARLDLGPVVDRRRLRRRRCATPDGHGAAGPPPGRPSGSVLNFGRYAGWSLGEIARHGHRVHRVARPGADRAAVPRRDRPASCGGRAGASRTAADAGSDRRGLYRRR